MPRLSQQKRDKIAEQLLHYLFTISPGSVFTVSIAKELARDEEFTRSLLLELQQKKLVVEVAKNPQGIDYKVRRRWRLSNDVYEVYKKHQPAPFPPHTSSQPLNNEPGKPDIPHYIG